MSSSKGAQKLAEAKDVKPLDTNSTKTPGVAAAVEAAGSKDNGVAVDTTPAETADLIDLTTTPVEEKTTDAASENADGKNVSMDKGKEVEKVEDTEQQQTEAPMPDKPVSISRQTTSTIDPMESSNATLKPEPTTPVVSTFNATGTTYLDPTPKTPLPSRTPLSSTAAVRVSDERSPTRSDSGFDEKPTASEDERDPQSTSEITNIMEQFADGGPGEEEVMSPRLEMAGPSLGSEIRHPPRKSSLVSLNKDFAKVIEKVHIGSPSSKRDSKHSDKGPEVPPKEASLHTLSPIRAHDIQPANADSPMSPHTTSIHMPPPPEPEPDLPFDFHRFLEQLRHKTADPVAKFLRSFLAEFGKKQWMVHEQVKIIGDFLVFITSKMAQCEVWRDVSDSEFDNAREGMEKLVMNRLYAQTFSPAIPPPQTIPGARSRRRGGERPLGPGRRGQHQEDVERDEVLAQKVSIYGWVKEEHLDIPPVGDNGKRFLVLAQQELLKIKTYRAPRDKIICVLNCCKVIFGLLKHSKSDGSADSFMPLLIYTVLHANPEHLVSNVQYILRFRNQDKLGGEAGYYLSSLSGAIQFIENLDRTSLTITDEEFEQHVEEAVSAIAEKHRSMELVVPPPPPPPKSFLEQAIAGKSSTNMPRKSREGSQTRAPAKPADGSEIEEHNEKAGAPIGPVDGLLRTFQRPLTTIGRMFTDDGPSSSNPSAPPSRSRPRTNRAATSPSQQLSPTRQPNEQSARQPSPLRQRQELSHEEISTRNLLAEDAAARQSSAETAEAQRLMRAEHANVVETLSGMFPDLDKELISDVVMQKNGRYVLNIAEDKEWLFG